MVIGTHNSMSYLRPTKLWMKLLAFTAKCQSKNVNEQFKAGARAFDLRVIFKEDFIKIAHGAIEYNWGEHLYDCDIYSLLEYLNHKSELAVQSNKPKLIVRVVNERDENYEKFISFCEEIKNKYPFLIFYGGINKKDWKVLYDFKSELPYKYIVEKYASCNYDDGINWSGCTKIDDILPWIYAKLNNKKWFIAFSRFEDNVCLIQDYL